MDRLTKHLRITDVGCWEWTGPLNGSGYGRFGSNTLSHRVAYELLVGPIPKGLVIDHLCRNTVCFRPDHLEAVTNAVNIARGYGASALNSRKTHCASGHEFDERNTYRWKGTRSCRICNRAAVAKLKASKR